MTKSRRIPKPETVALDPLAPRIEEALLHADMSATKFGYLHFGDPAFITKMRRGRRFYDSTRAKVEAVLMEIGV